MLFFINYWSLESMSVIIWVSPTCTWDQRPAIVKTKFISMVTIIKVLVRGFLSQHDSIKSFFMRDEFDIKWIKFVYQTPYLSLVIIEMIESTKHEISPPRLMTNRGSPNTFILLTFKSIAFCVLELGHCNWHHCLYIQIPCGMQSLFFRHVDQWGDNQHLLLVYSWKYQSIDSIIMVSNYIQELEPIYVQLH